MEDTIISFSHKTVKRGALVELHQEIYRQPPNVSSVTRKHRKKKKMESFWPKKLSHWVTGGTKFWHGILSNWRMSKSNWLDIESQIDSNILEELGIPDCILVPTSDSNFLGQNDSIFLSVFLKDGSRQSVNNHWLTLYALVWRIRHELPKFRL